MKYIRSSSGTDYKRGYHLNLTLIKTNLYSMFEEIKQQPMRVEADYSLSFPKAGLVAKVIVDWGTEVVELGLGEGGAILGAR